MFFVIVGLLLIVLNLAGVGPMALWNWEITGDLWKFVVPFIFAVLWWWWSDVTGLNKRREMDKMDAKKQKRRQENLEALGMGGRKSRKR
jgi:small Trp-rich protein